MEYSPRITAVNGRTAVSDMPSAISRLRRPTSRSMQSTFCPSIARQDAILAHSEVLPVPPLPEMTARTCAICRPSRMLISFDIINDFSLKFNG